MTEPPDLVAEYLQLIMNGARPGDPRLFALFEQMTPPGVSRVKELLIAEYVRTLPPPDSGAAVLDVCDLYIEIVKRGARPDDRRLAMLIDMMSNEELARAKTTIGELWLRAEARPARVN